VLRARLHRRLEEVSTRRRHIKTRRSRRKCPKHQATDCDRWRPVIQPGTFAFAPSSSLKVSHHRLCSRITNADAGKGRLTETNALIRFENGPSESRESGRARTGTRARLLIRPHPQNPHVTDETESAERLWNSQGFLSRRRFLVLLFAPPLLPSSLILVYSPAD